VTVFKLLRSIEKQINATSISGIDRTAPKKPKKPKYKETTSGGVPKKTSEWNSSYDKKMALHKKQIKAKKAFDALSDKDKKFFSE
jgi:hypothetical protein